MKIYNFLTFLWLQPWKRLLPLNIMVFCPQHHKRDQNLKCTPLSETMSIPAPFILAIETKPLVYVLIHGTIMFFVCATNSQVWISFLNPEFALPWYLGSFFFGLVPWLPIISPCFFFYISACVCVVIVFITQVIPKVFFNYIIIQSLLFTSLKLREYFLSDNLH